MDTNELPAPELSSPAPTTNGSEHEQITLPTVGSDQLLAQIQPSIVPQTQKEVDNLHFNGLWPGATETMDSVAQTAYDRARGMIENRQLRYEAERDERTGLLKRNSFLSKISESLAAASPNEVFALFAFDIDEFKAVNDKHPGHHAAGDAVIKDVAAMLSMDTRLDPDPLHITSEDHPDSSVAARLGGDEFASFTELIAREDPNLTPEQRLNAVLTRRKAQFEKYIESRPDLAAIPGFGISVAGVLCRKGDDPKQLLAHADNDMMDIKEQRKALNGGGYRN
jgi:diguanylate cyclase (GGDEF)-like protein